MALQSSKLIRSIGSLILLAIAPISLWISDLITQRRDIEIINRQEEISKKLLGYVDKEAIEAEVFSSFFSSTVFADDRGIIVSATLGAGKLFGYNHVELRGMNVNDLMPERFKSKHNLKYFRRANEPYDPTKVVVVSECYGLRKDKTEVKVEVRTRVIKTETGILLIARFTEIKNIVVIPNNKETK